ncbi:MAG: PAS domain-containing protein [Planctomycetes bacterium]|nr:PAS domain-containing protein [Planctomycetota bacterium]
MTTQLPPDGVTGGAARPDEPPSRRVRKLSLLLDNIIESVPMGIIAIGLDGKVLAVNANAEFLFGLRRVYVIGESYEAALPASITPVFTKLKLGLQADKASADADATLSLPRNEGMQIGVSASHLLDREGKPQGYLFLCRDQSLSREVQQLRDLDQLKTDFLNTASHELKTPLTAIMAGVELLAADAGKFGPAAAPLFEVIGDSALRLNALVNDMLGLMRLESGRARLHACDCDVALVARDAIASLKETPRHKLCLDIPAGLPRVMIDRDNMLMALRHLLKNAVKYSPDGGEITLAVRVGNNEIEFSVADRGIGISRENQEKLWQKFFRVDTSYTSNFEGSGLGLAIVKHVAQLHGGTVFVQSEPGRGSTFGMRLPLRARASELVAAGE